MSDADIDDTDLLALPPAVEALLFNDILRRDFVAFCEMVFATVAPGIQYEPNWHIEAMAGAAAEVRSGKHPRLIVNCPPRALKSIIFSVALPAFMLGHDPTQKIVVASYGAELSRKLARDFRLVVNSPWFRRLFPKFRIERDTEMELVTTGCGFRYATSVGGALTGRGGDLIIIDDPIKGDDALSRDRRESVVDWYQQSLLSRLDDKRSGKIIVVMQRVHVDDLSGHLLKAGGFRHLNLPAIAPEECVVSLYGNRSKTWREGEPLDANRLPLEVLKKLRGEMGSFAFSAQYLQEPIPEDGEIIKWGWFGAYSTLPARESGDMIVQSWDTAAKTSKSNDFSVCTTWMLKPNGDAYLLHIYRGKLIFPDLVREVETLARAHAADAVLIEDAGSGTGLIQNLRSTPLDVIEIKPDGDKIMRMSVQSPAIESGKVFLPKEASWLDQFRLEVAAFPNGSHDDQIDSLSQFLRWARERRITGPMMYSFTGRLIWPKP